MNRLSRLLSRAAILGVIAGMLVLSACSSGVKSTETVRLEKGFPVTVQSYKSGQFLLDGAVLSAMDLSSHFAYLRDQGKLPSRVLIKRSDESKIRKAHLMAMARMQLDYGFSVYYEEKGEIKRLVVTDKKDVPKLREHSQRNQLPDELKGRSARGQDEFSPSGSGY